MNFFFAFIIAALLAYLITPLIIKLYHKLNWLDDPKKTPRLKNTHQTPVPRGGGLPIFLSLIITSLIFLPLDKHLIGILIAGLVLLNSGILDDLFDLSPYLRLLLNFLAAFIVIRSGIAITFIANPITGNIINFTNLLSFFITTIWIVSLTNFINWSKGFDGQLPGIVVIAALTIALLSLKFSAEITLWPVIILALITAGAYLGFLPFNFFPQKIMPGYSGGALAGFLLAVLSILSTTKVGTAIMVLFIPLLDAVFAIIRRLAKKQSPVWGDRGHLHHLLLDRGYSKRNVAYFYWISTAILGFIALKLNPLAKLATIAVLFFIFTFVFLWLNHSSTTSSKQPARKDG